MRRAGAEVRARDGAALLLTLHAFLGDRCGLPGREQLVASGALRKGASPTPANGGDDFSANQNNSIQLNTTQKGSTKNAF